MKWTGEPGTLIGYAGFEAAGSGNGAINCYRATPRPYSYIERRVGEPNSTMCVTGKIGPDSVLEPVSQDRTSCLIMSSVI